MPESIGSQFFAIHELLLLVLSYLSPSEKGTINSIDRDSLAVLARVSRTISDVALDALWRSIHQPEALVGLLPSDACEVKETWNKDHNCPEKQFRLLRRLTSDDFTVFDKYASRVRYVDFTNSSRILGRGCELFPYIKEFRNPILPALLYFRWEASAWNGSVGALHLLSQEAAVPSEEFSLLLWGEMEHIAGESEVIASTIDAFNDPALPWLPDVKKLTLRTIHYLPALRTAVPRLSNLEHFSCDLSIDDLLYQSLAALPGLRFIDFRSLPSAAVAYLPAGSPSFDSLEGFSISGTLSSIQSFLPHISSPDLSSVRLVVKDFQSRPIESTLFSLLLPPTIPTRASSLQHFTFVGPSASARAQRLDRLILAAFAPLYACRALQTFYLEIDAGSLVLTDDDVNAMSSAWPALSTFIIIPPRSANVIEERHVHLYALWAFAARCPSLRRLQLEVDADVVGPFSEDYAAIDAESPPMEDLTLFCSPCGDPLLVAEFLKRAFPRLRHEAFHAYPTKGRPQDKERWAVVTWMLESN
ncbi:hypothetical protein FB45DRAFT_361438 [Roridomyces roridus]|uniref:F-box domain-containing protein n=1 Tax=Roridomyces roridus TaxID=1738132 RepID=A0AAD7C835_9AGAR|nr:hypothetical protein FB45DRAFT_361438 [Roridomyces roridus]